MFRILSMALANLHQSPPETASRWVYLTLQGAVSWKKSLKVY